MTIYPQIPLAQQIIQGCKAKGIRHIVLSPGSRNIPLIMGFSSDAFFKCYSIVDERSAAFFALGMAQQVKMPVAVVCTSGSAVLNYYPAVSEAYYANIPLVVISADRPPHKIDIGDGQTIRQVGVLAHHTAYNANLQPENEVFNQEQINQALNTAMVAQLPVHINAPFEEPLFGFVEQVSVVFQNEPAPTALPYLGENKAEELVTHWQKSEKILVLLGVMPPHSIDAHWLSFLEENGAVVLSETMSNVAHRINYIPIDALLAKAEKEAFLPSLRPDLLLSFGGMLVSKRIKEFLRKYPPVAHYHIDPLVGYDTYGTLNHHFKCSANAFLSQHAHQMHCKAPSYALLYKQIKVQLPKECFFQQLPYSDFWVYAQVLSALPAHLILQISNSFAVRYAQFFTPKEGWEVYCNRGTSGIDGVVSTAIGAAAVSEKPVLLLTGDLSFFYDSNAFWNNYLPATFKVILINNGGGGIFRAIFPHKVHSYFSPYIETAHSLSAAHLCQMHQVQYFKASCKQSLEEQLPVLLASCKPALLEIFTSPADNDKAYAAYFSS